MSNNLLPGAEDLQALGREMLAASARNREAIAKGNATWQHNENVYSTQRSGPEASTRAEGLGLRMAGRDEPRCSWQAGMSESGRPLGPFSEPFSLLTRSQVERLRSVARTAKGRRKLSLLVASMREAMRK